jgi:hypothetical protein
MKGAVKKIRKQAHDEWKQQMRDEFDDTFSDSDESESATDDSGADSGNEYYPGRIDNVKTLRATLMRQGHPDWVCFAREWVHLFSGIDGHKHLYTVKAMKEAAKLYTINFKERADPKFVWQGSVGLFYERTFMDEEDHRMKRIRNQERRSENFRHYIEHRAMFREDCQAKWIRDQPRREAEARQWHDDLVALRHSEMQRRAIHLEKFGLTHHLFHPQCAHVRSEIIHQPSEVRYQLCRSIVTDAFVAQVLQPLRARQTARKSVHGKKPSGYLQLPGVQTKELWLETPTTYQDLVAHVDGKGAAVLQGSWMQCRILGTASNALPTYLCSLCDQSFVCTPFCGACLVFEVCRQNKWGASDLTSNQIMQIQDRFTPNNVRSCMQMDLHPTGHFQYGDTADMMAHNEVIPLWRTLHCWGSTAVTRGEIEAPSRYTPKQTYTAGQMSKLNLTDQPFWVQHELYSRLNMPDQPSWVQQELYSHSRGPCPCGDTGVMQSNIELVRIYGKNRYNNLYDQKGWWCERCATWGH